jgi:hypothetical protein
MDSGKRPLDTTTRSGFSLATTTYLWIALGTESYNPLM